MSVIGIGLLHNINEVLEKINSLKEKIDLKKASLSSIQEKNSKEEETFKQNQIQIQIQDKILEQFNQMQKVFLEHESNIRQNVAIVIEKSINDYLSEENLKNLLAKISSNNSGTASVLHADPEIANQLNLSDYSATGKGQLRLSFDHKTYVLDLESLKEQLRSKLLINTLSK
jgi:hypothetical protein